MVLVLMRLTIIKMTLKIKHVKRFSEEIKKEAIENLINHFNELAKEMKFKYRIGFSYGHPHLFHKVLFFENYSNQIVYLGEYFKFADEIDETILNEIALILEQIPEEFRVELRK